MSHTSSMPTSSPPSPPTAKATDNINRNMPSAKTSAKAIKKHLSDARVTEYLEDPQNSQVLHRHASGEESVRVHTLATKEYLDSIDTFMKEFGA